MADFIDDLGAYGYEMPEGAPPKQEYEEFSYYQHPVGTYLGFIGKLGAKFKGTDGKSATPDTPFAKFDHYQLPIWIFKFLGSANAPTQEEIIVVSPTGNLILPPRPMFETYFGMYISVDPQRIWGLSKTFGNWAIPGHSKYNIIQPNPKNPANKTIFYSGFPAYYGLPCKFTLTFKPDSEKKQRYIEGALEIVDYGKRVPLPILQQFEKDVETKVRLEQAERATKSNKEYVAETPPETNFDELGAASGEDDLSSFMK